MARRREYVSFFRDTRGRRREFTAFEGKRGPSVLLLPLLALAVLGVSLWWYAIRDTRGAGDDITLEDINVPSVLFPVDEGGQLVSVTSETRCTITAEGWPTFQGTPQRTGCISAPTISDPIVLWQESIGVQGWLNNPVVIEDVDPPIVVVGSAGTGQGSRDNSDGVYALDLATGQRRWFFGAELDVNGVGYGSGTVIATGDEGRVWALTASDGRLVWSDDLEAPTFGNPLTINGMAVIVDRDGRVTAFDIRSGDRLWQNELEGPIRGGAASNGEVIIVNTELRNVAAYDMAGEELWQVNVRGGEPRADQSRLWGAPTIVGDLVILGLVRDDVFAEPAVIALNIADGTLAWQALDTAGIRAEWANIRASFTVVEGLLLYGQPYSDQMIAIDPSIGETLWAITVGIPCQQHWPSAAVVGDLVILPKQDGVVYAISLTNQGVEWELYIGSPDAGGRFPEDYGPDFCDSLPEDAYPIQASPAIASDGTILVGTLDGRLVAIGSREG